MKNINRTVDLPLNYLDNIDRAVMNNILWNIEDGLWECDKAEQVFRNSFELYSDTKTGKMKIFLYDEPFGFKGLYNWGMLSDNYLFIQLAEYIYRIAKEYFKIMEYDISAWEKISEDCPLICEYMWITEPKMNTFSRYMTLGEMKHYYNLFTSYFLGKPAAF